MGEHVLGINTATNCPTNPRHRMWRNEAPVAVIPPLSGDLKYKSAAQRELGSAHKSSRRHQQPCALNITEVTLHFSRQYSMLDNGVKHAWAKSTADLLVVEVDQALVVEPGLQGTLKSGSL